MRKLILLFSASLFTQAAIAQHWTQLPVTGTRNLEQIKEEQEKKLAAQKWNEDEEEEEMEEGRVRKEGKNYHFSRWLNYWQRHLDAEGNMVSPAMTFREWNNYTQKEALKKKVFKTTTNQSQWTFTGPTTSSGGYAGIGRINVVTFHPTDTSTFIIGSAGGGAWRTTNGGLNWTPLYNNLPVLGVSDVDYNPLNPNTIYLCTGDRDASDTYSVGVLKSTDGGATWQTTGLQADITDFMLMNELLINPLDTNSLIVAASNGIYKSYDAGATWTHTTFGHFKDIAYNPADTNIIYGATYVNGTSNIFRSINGGVNWTAATNLNNAYRIALAVSPADPSIVKAVVADGDYALHGIYHSSDAGASFVKIFGDENDCTTNILSGSLELDNGTCSGQGWYDLCIAMNPVDPNIIMVGGVNTYQSLDGGFSFNMVTEWYSSSPGVKTVHADKHYITFHPLNPSLMYECNDGGLYRTADPSSLLWNDLTNGLGITQFYRNAVADVADYVIGGSQDNGTKRITFGGAFQELTGGDGMDCQINYVDPSNFYTSSQFGRFNRTTNNGLNFQNISGNIPGDPDGAWITPFIIHPTDPTTVLAGYHHVFISFDMGDSWTDISPSFPPSTELLRLAMTPADPQMIVAQSNTNTIRYTLNLGGNWSLVPAGFLGASSISDVTIDPWNKNRIWITYSGYSNPRVATYEIGVGWTARTDSLPSIPVNCIVIDSSNGTKYIGTDVAVFYRDTSMAKWELYNSGLPTIEVTDLAINYTTNEIWGSTYGRGMWKSPKHTPEPPISGIGTLPLAMDVLSISPNPNKGEFEINTSNTALFNQPVEVNVISYSGAVAMKANDRFTSNGKLKISGSNLTRGTYIVEVNKGGSLFARAKMIVL